MSSAYRGPSHADVCRKLAGTGPCDCCEACGDHRYAATDGRCLVCHPQPVPDGEPYNRRPDRVVTRTDAGAVVLVDRTTGEVLEEDAPAPAPVCEFEPLDPLSPASEFAPVANVVPANVSPEHPEPIATEEAPAAREWVTCPGGCGVLKDATKLDVPCRSCPDDLPRAAVSHAADPDLVVADTPGIVGNASPPTSHAAAAAVPTGKRRQEVLMVLAREREGATAEELEALTGRGGSTIRPRLLELERDGFVVRGDDTRPTRSGLQAVVWRATPRGRSAADRLAGRPDGMP